MSLYCTIEDVQNILPKKVIIGTNLLKQDVNVTQEQAEFFIEQASGIVDSSISTIYRIPLIQYKEPDFSQNPVTFTSVYPPPISLITARLAASYLYDKIIMAQQEPNVSDWGKNQRSLAYDDLTSIQSGIIQLKGQVFTGLRFVPQELFDPSRAPFNKNNIQPHTRTAGQ